MKILLELKIENIFIDAYEFIDVAIKNNKMNLFTNLIIEQIGKIYSTYGQTLFRNGCLDRLSINVDSSYFNDGNFINEIGGLLTIYNFNKGVVDTFVDVSLLAKANYRLITVGTTYGYLGAILAGTNNTLY